MSTPHEHGNHDHGHADERDPPMASPSLIMTVGAVIFVLICLFLIGIERSWKEAVRRDLDAQHRTPSFGEQVRARQEAHLQAGVHAFPAGDPNEALSGKRHASIEQAMDAVVQKYGKR